MDAGRRRSGLLTLLVLLILATSDPGGQVGGQFEYPFSVAVDSAGNLYVSERDRHRVDKLDAQGQVLWRSGTRGSGADQFNGPAGIALDSQGSIFVADSYNARVQKLSPTGASIGRWGSWGSGPGQFHRPAAIAVDSRDNVYVLDSDLRRVQKFRNDGGAYYGSWGAVGTGDGQFSPLGGGPRDIVIDPSDNAYVSDTSGYRILKWQINSNVTGAIVGTTFLGWSGRCNAGTNCDVAPGRSRGFACTAATCSGGGPGDQPGQFTNPFGLALDSAGSLFVADFDNNRVQKFGSNGGILTTWGRQGTDPDSFRGPLDVAAFGTAAVYVTDMRNKRVMKFTNTGTSVAVFGGDIALSAVPGYPPANLDALVDPNPFFLLPAQTKTSTLTVQSLAGFQGDVALSQSCCRDLLTDVGSTPPGVSIGISPNFVTVPSNAAAQATVSVTASATPTAGKFLGVIGAQTSSGISRQIGLGFEIVPIVPDSTIIPCPTFYHTGITPDLLPLRPALTSVFAVKAATLSKVRFRVGVAAPSFTGIGWILTIDKATGLTPPLRANETLVVFSNTTGSLKGVLAIDSRSCGLLPANGVVVNTGQAGTMRISTADTTTLVLSEQTREIGVFSESNFWALFGGRKLTVEWLGR